MKDKIHQILEDVWGYKEFRPLQEDIINSVISGDDTLALLPTGGGKSICFQVPALALGGMCLVISPLIALMKDQVENLQKKGISAHAIYTGMSVTEIERILDNATYGKIKFLYVSPERLESGVFKLRVEKLPIKLLAIDEAHCISQWGYDFRPSYLNIARIRPVLKNVPLIALTATATNDVKKDIQDKLEFKSAKVFQKSFERENLIYATVFEEGKRNKLIDILKKVKGSGIVYVNSRKGTLDISDFLVRNKISADYYHGGLDQQKRNLKQENWIKNKTRIIVSTNAFGMGIDKPDVRIVVHMNLPESLEAYYQEAGRGGRDLKRSFAIAIVNENDRSDLTRRIELTFPEVSEIKNVYHSLGNFLQIPIGSGKNEEFDFEFSDFCSKYNFNPAKTINSLKALEKLNYIGLTDEVYLPSRLIFKLSYNDLYKFQVDNPKYEPLIKFILRSYDGVFDIYTKINENKIAKSLGFKTQKLISQLTYLCERDILDYIKSKNKPQIIYFTDRLDKNTLFIDSTEIDKRKKIFITKINSVIEYAYKENTCRSKILLDYFGESLSSDCGHCDYCLKKKSTAKSEKEIQNKILNLLKNNPVKSEVVLKELSEFDKKELIKIIRILIDENKVGKDDSGLLHLI